MVAVEREPSSEVPVVEDLGLPTKGRSKKWVERRTVWSLRVVVAAVLFVIWQQVTARELVRPLFLPSPSKVYGELERLISSGDLWTHVGATLYEMMAGFVIGMVSGVIAGFLLGLSPLATKVANPFVGMANSLPRIALAPLFIVWFGVDSSSRIALVVSLVFFIALTNSLGGARSVDRDHLMLAKLNKASTLQQIFKVTLPTAVPWIVAAARLSLAYALAGAIVGQMFLGQEGLGYLIAAGSGVFNIGLIFAALMVTVAIAFVLDSAIAMFERRFLRWQS